VKLYHEIHGQGPTLLLLHAGLCSIPVWPQPIEYFSKEYQVIVPEQMGHGRTPDDSTRPMDYHLMAEDTAALLAELKIESAYVLGWSDGGIVGLDLAIHHPTLVKKLAISGSNFSPPPADQPGAVQMTADDIPPFIREPYERLSPDGPAYWPTIFARVQRMWKTQPNFTKAQLGAIASPTLVIAGDRDFSTPEYNIELWRAIPKADLWIAPGVGHGLPLQRPALFNAAVRTFFGGARCP